MTMTKSELVKAVVKNSDLKKAEASDLIDDFFEIISESLEQGESVKIPGFGNFILRDKNPRMGRNPKTLKEHIITARRVVSFRTSNSLKLSVRDDEDN